MRNTYPNHTLRTFRIPLNSGSLERRTDLSSLLLEAHRQNYAGEWIVGGNVMGSLDTILDDLNEHLDEGSTHKLLRGTFDFVLAEE